MYYIDNFTAIDADTIMELAITDDCDSEGYRISDKSINRRMMAGRGVEDDGNWYLWIISNGDPCPLTDDNHMDICHAMADGPAHDLEQGYERIAAGIETLSEYVKDNELLDACGIYEWRIHLEFLLHERYGRRPRARSGAGL